MSQSLLADVNIPNTFFGCARPQGCNVSLSSPGQLISLLLPNLMMLSGIILLFTTLYYGFRMIQLADTHSPQDLAKAQSATTMSVVGFLLVITSYFILQLVESTLGINIIDPIF